MRPDFGHVEDIPLVSLGFFWVHGLHIDIPYGKITSFDGFIHVLQVKVWILSSNSYRLSIGHILDANLGFDVDLDVFEGAVL